MISHSRTLIVLAVMLTGLLMFFKIPVASSQGATIEAGLVEEELPLEDPDAERWLATTAIHVPLSAQNVAKPYLIGAHDRSVSVRALHNGEQIAIRLEWEDDTLNDDSVRVQDFHDAVAVQFPLVENQPYFCMGQQGGNVNIWHWKADWQAEMVAWRDVNTAYQNMYVDEYTFAVGEGAVVAISPLDYTDTDYLPALSAGNLFASPQRPSPVEDLIAGGFGTLTAQALVGQNVHGTGIWKDGKWKVIVSRTIESEEPEDIHFRPGRVYPVAFAIWDGDHQERNGQKSTSQWLSLRLTARAAALQPGEQTAPVSSPPYHIPWILAGLIAVLLVIGTIIYIRLPQ